jgi:membrane associated rhomboid family serine protease
LYGRGYNTSGFGPPVTPNVIKQIIIANVAVFVAQNLAPQLTLLLSVIPYRFWHEGYIWQPFTYMWLHSPGSLAHIGFNMLALWMFGSPMASAWGERRFLRFYVLCGIGAGFIIALWPELIVLFGLPAPPSYGIPTLGASGAVFGVLLAYSLTFPNRTIMLIFPPIPMKAIYFIPFILAVEWLFGPSNVSSVGHLGGLLVGWVLLRRMSGDSLRPSLGPLKYRWRRWRMRRRLRAVQTEDDRWRRTGSDDDRKFH